jgi:hypothetical protein
MDSTLLAGNRSSVGIAVFWQRATTASQWGVLGRPLCCDQPLNLYDRTMGSIKKSSVGRVTVLMIEHDIDLYEHLRPRDRHAPRAEIVAPREH